jgi:alpha-L-fucosidase
LRELGETIRRIYTNNLATQAAPAADGPGAVSLAADGDLDTFWSAPADARSAVLTLTFKSPVTFDRAVAMEFLNDGQKIHKYDIQVAEGKGWRTIASGASIGHKKIDLFDRVTTGAARLRILAAAGPPRIREFQLYYGSR